MLKRFLEKRGSFVVSCSFFVILSGKIILVFGGIYWWDDEFELDDY